MIPWYSWRAFYRYASYLINDKEQNFFKAYLSTVLLFPGILNYAFFLNSIWIKLFLAFIYVNIAFKNMYAFCYQSTLQV